MISGIFRDYHCGIFGYYCKCKHYIFFLNIFWGWPVLLNQISEEMSSSVKYLCCFFLMISQDMHEEIGLIRSHESTESTGKLVIFTSQGYFAAQNQNCWSRNHSPELPVIQHHYLITHKCDDKCMRTSFQLSTSITGCYHKLFRSPAPYLYSMISLQSGRSYHKSL